MKKVISIIVTCSLFLIGCKNIDGPKEGEDGKFSLDNKNEHTSKMRIIGRIPNASDRDVRVKIDWNGKTETAMLKMAE